MNCSKCQRKVEPGDRFCAACGAPVTAAPGPGVVETPGPRVGAIGGNANFYYGGPPAGSAPGGDYCPLCGVYNQPERTFRCRQCGRSFLCLTHRNSRTFLCCECSPADEEVQPSSGAAPLAAERIVAGQGEEPTAGAIRVLEKARLKLVYVPAGTYWIGSADSDPHARPEEKPRHQVVLDGYWIGETEVTNAQYRLFVEAGGYDTRAYWSETGWGWKGSTRLPRWWNDSRWNGEQQPVLGVSWYEAEAFCRWTGGRLPTEAEWENAARGGPLSRGHIYPGSDQVDEVAWYGSNSGRVTHSVRGKQANELGLYDMGGNVAEWAADWYDANYYAYSPRANPAGPAVGTTRVLRGGSWYYKGAGARCAYRGGGYDPGERRNYVGFRVAL
ncbi:MAG TPA: SUMF1/EgtB/PvdO family nonheme iron enzyme [Anaerolineae bacterium]|nr:SUMF1/EgtB/PvdO family nonheme iron enzyme [Anaerolineae bacterium]HNT05227.1 SUMF1/EgtB/PvdO family nonheme iron enzyme [Anaerolineae bacterium]HQJ52479.1 SUMF1/EgtB/PvdO family nonheme iron enzyme [Anaerolineae bacterium]